MQSQNSARETTIGRRQFTLDIQNIATHTHKVDLSADDMTAIAANQRVSRESTTDSGHSHTVTFN